MGSRTPDGCGNGDERSKVGIIRRQRRGRGFVFLTDERQPVRSEQELRRIQALGIPPAWSDVYIAASPRARIQATGRDAKGRKQYRYRSSWSSGQSRVKFARMASFGVALPKIRRQVERDLARPGLPREKILAALVHVMETTLIRIGNDEYARHNDSYGLTTLRDDHATVSSSSVVFCFRGKSGREHRVRLSDRRLARIIGRCRALPGNPLFQYIDAAGATRRVRSTDVNAYLRSIVGAGFSAKDFRTWAGTLCCAQRLWGRPWPETEMERKRAIKQAIEQTSRQLGNTPAVCRSAYIHPAVLDAFASGNLKPPPGSKSDEAALLTLLRQSVGRAATPTSPHAMPVIERTRPHRAP